MKPRQLRAVIAVLLLGVLLTFVVPIGASPLGMSSPKAIFFTSGLQQRLEIAIRSNDGPTVRAELLAGAQANAKGRKDATPLMIAVDVQAEQAVAILVSHGADPNLRATDGTTAVHLAVENHAKQPSGRRVLEAVMRAGGDPNARRPDGDPVIMRFLYDRDFDDLRWFRSLGADLDVLSRTERPLIVYVSLSQDWDSVWCLIELGAKYDYEQSFNSLSRSLQGALPSVGTPMYAYKEKVWQFLKDKGIAVPPLQRGPLTPPASPPVP